MGFVKTHLIWCLQGTPMEIQGKRMWLSSHWFTAHSWNHKKEDQGRLKQELYHGRHGNQEKVLWGRGWGRAGGRPEGTSGCQQPKEGIRTEKRLFMYSLYYTNWESVDLRILRGSGNQPPWMPRDDCVLDSAHSGRWWSWKVVTTNQSATGCRTNHQWRQKGRRKKQQ